MAATSGAGAGQDDGLDSGLGPPSGRYSVERVASRARTADPGLPEETARELAVHAWDHLRAIGELDAPEVARRLLADHGVAGATAASVVARAAVDHCEEYDVPLTQRAS